MKAFISVDLEGLPYVVIPGQLSLKGSLYEEGRKIATEITQITIQALHENGFEQIIVADSHGPMVNLLVEDLPEYVEIVRGNPRPVSMVAGVHGCDVALFLGYHAKFGTAKATFDHTYSGGTIHKVEVNGVPASEFLLNAYAAGEYGVPVILVAGDATLLKEDVGVFTPWAERVSFKQSLSRLSAISPSMKKIAEALKIGVKNAVQKFNDNKVEPLIAPTPIQMAITFQASHFADVAALLPNSQRKDGLTVEYKATNMIEGYKTFQLLVAAATGTRTLLDFLK
ncbi:MAG: peptide transporter [Candidatus Heimdallarchaeota archaeon]|nr:peptide transporter [Candidatus Heimdallarchaeota archaeon]